MDSNLNKRFMMYVHDDEATLYDRHIDPSDYNWMTLTSYGLGRTKLTKFLVEKYVDIDLDCILAATCRCADIDMIETSGAGNATRLVAEADFSAYDGLVAAGGDGTLFEVLNGLSASCLGPTRPHANGGIELPGQDCTRRRLWRA